MLITANADKATKAAAREIAFRENKSVRQWAGEVIKKAVQKRQPKPIDRIPAKT